MRSHSIRGLLVALVLLALAWATPALADETCNSPYMGNLIKGQEDYVYVWTLGVEGRRRRLGQARHDRRQSRSRKSYGKVIHKVSVGARGEAHHMGFTDDRRFLWAGGLDDSTICGLRHRHRPGQAAAREDASPTCGERPATSGRTPSTRCRAACWCRRLSNTKDKGGVTGMALYNNKGELHRHATRCRPPSGGRRLRLRPRDQSAEERAADLELHRAAHNYMRPLGELDARTPRP